MEVQYLNSPTQNKWPHFAKKWSPQIKLYELLNKLVVIYVQSQVGDFTKITTTPNCTISYVKEKVERKIGIKTEDQCLIFQGQCLKNDKTVADCDLTSCSVIEVISTKTIEVKAQNGSLIAVEVRPHENVISIKQKIKKKSGIPVRRQCLLLNGTQLENDQELCSCDFKNEAEFYLATSIQIFVRNLSGKTRLLHIEQFHTIEDIKGLIEAREAIPRKFISLSYAGKLLESHRALSDYNLQNESTINMNVRFNSIQSLSFGAKNVITSSDADDYDSFSSSFNSDLHNSTMIEC